MEELHSNRMPTDSRSSPRKEIDSSFSWKKYNGGYASVDLMSRVNSMLLFSLSNDLYDVNFPDISRRRLKRYLKLRKLPNTEGVELTGKNSCYSNIEAVLSVRSLSGKKWKERAYKKVTINNLVGEDEPLERKIDSIKNINVVCSCARTSFVHSCRVPTFQRDIFRDPRGGGDVPGPFVDSEFCKHALVAMDYVTTFDGAANFGFFGIYGDRTITVANQVIEYILRKKLKLTDHSDYTINESLNRRKVEDYRTYLRYWSEPLREFIFHRGRL